MDAVLRHLDVRFRGIARWRNKPIYILFALGGFSPELEQLAADPAERSYLVVGIDMLGGAKPDRIFPR